MNKIITFFIFILLLNCIFLHPKVLYRISGKVVLQGEGIPKIEVQCRDVNEGNKYRTLTDDLGNYIFYLPNGVYRLFIEAEKYISKDLYKTITINKKNIQNVNFFMELTCTISGKVRFEDGSIPDGAEINIRNDRKYPPSGWVDSDGNYKITQIGASDVTEITLYVPGFMPQTIKDIILTEGQSINDLDFVLKKKLSIKGTIINQQTKESVNDALISLYIDKITFMALQNEQGEFYFYNLKSGSYILICQSLTYELKTIDFYYDENQLKTMTIEVVPLKEN